MKFCRLKLIRLVQMVCLALSLCSLHGSAQAATSLLPEPTCHTPIPPPTPEDSSSSAASDSSSTGGRRMLQTSSSSTAAATTSSTDTSTADVTPPYKYCEMLKPGCLQYFDNTEMGGSYNDDMIIYKMGKKDYDVNLWANFRQTNSKCKTLWSLKVKLADGKFQDVNTEFPHVKIIWANNAGAARIRFNYNKRQVWRSTHEQVEQSWVLTAQGAENKKINPRLSPVEAEVIIKVKFERDCTGGVVYNTPHLQALDLNGHGTSYIVMQDQPITKTIDKKYVLEHSDTLNYCKYNDKHELKAYQLAAGSSSKQVVLNTNIYTLNQAERSIEISVSSDTMINSYNRTDGVECSLGNFRTRECSFTIVLYETGLFGDYPPLAKFTVKFYSECYRLRDIIKSKTLHAAIWSWSQTEQDKMAKQYRLRDPMQDWKLPTVTPVLFSGEDLQTRCGPLNYDIVKLDAPTYYTVVEPSDYKTAISMSIESSDEALVHKYAADDFERVWVNAELRAIFVNGTYPDIVFKNPFPLQHKISDYCLGWTMSEPNITILNPETVRTSFNYPRPEIIIERYVLSEKTRFDFSKVQYTQLDKTKIEVGCGNLEYIPHFWTTQADGEPHPLSELIWKEIGDYDQPDQLRFHLLSNTNDFIGNHAFIIEVHSDIMLLEPHHKFTVVIRILPCFVRGLDYKRQNWGDMTVITGTTRAVDFEEYEQVPLCNYTTYYSVTMYEKFSGPDGQDVNYRDFEDGQVFGEQPNILVQYDRELRQVIFDARDPDLLNQTFQVFITCHVMTSKAVQEFYYGFMPPFDLTVIPDPNLWPMPNNAPDLEDFVEEITLTPGVQETHVIGVPYDIQEDPFYVRGWEIVEGIVIPWIKFDNQTSQTAITFHFDPPELTGAMSFTIKLTLVDKNERKPKQESYSISVKVDGEGYVPDFSTTVANLIQEEEIVKPEEFIYKELNVQVSEPSNSGLVTIDFGVPLALPANLTLWNQDNEGGKLLSIQYTQSEESEEFFEELKLTIQFGWRVTNVKYAEETEIRRRQLQGAHAESSSTVEAPDGHKLVLVKSFQIKMAWTQPLYVSAYQEKDILNAMVDPKLFAYDEDVKISKDEVEMIYFRGKLSKQVSAEQLETIEQVGDTTSGFLQLFMSTNIFFSIFMIQILQYLWGLINTLQMIVIIVLFNIQFPLNCAKILIDIMQLANLDLLNVDKYTNAIFNFQSESLPFNNIFDEAGFSSSTFTVELGLLFFMISFSILFAIVKVILKASTRQCGTNCLTRRVRKPVNTMVIIVRFLMESCNEMGLAALITILMSRGQDRWYYFSDGLDIVMAWCALICLSLAPFFVYHYGRRLIYRRLGMLEHQQDSVASLFEQYKENDISGVRFSVIFFFRRFIMILILVVLPTWKIAQINSQIVMALCVTAFTAHYLPYKVSLQNKQEAFNEWTVLAGSYHLFMFTNWISDEERRYELGWSLIALICVNVIINFGLAGFVGVQAFCRRLKLRYLKNQQEQRMSEQMRRRAERSGHQMLTIDGTLRDRHHPASSQMMVLKKQQNDRDPISGLELVDDYVPPTPRLLDGNQVETKIKLGDKSLGLDDSSYSQDYNPASQRLVADYVQDVIIEQPGDESEHSERQQLPSQRPAYGMNYDDSQGDYNPSISVHRPPKALQSPKVLPISLADISSFDRDAGLGNDNGQSSENESELVDRPNSYRSSRYNASNHLNDAWSFTAASQNNNNNYKTRFNSSGFGNDQFGTSRRDDSGPVSSYLDQPQLQDQQTFRMPERQRTHKIQLDASFFPKRVDQQQRSTGKKYFGTDEDLFASNPDNDPIEEKSKEELESLPSLLR